VLRTPEDFSRAVYEYCEDAKRDGNLRHVEFFFNPDYFYPNGIDYPSMVAGMVDGIERVARAFGISPADLLHRSVDQLLGPGRRDLRDGDRARNEWVVGIGLDGTKEVGPPAIFAKPMTWRAKRGSTAQRIAAKTT
jgi:adenosine deaminase